MSSEILNAGLVLGYARVSTVEENEDLQRDEVPDRGDRHLNTRRRTVRGCGPSASHLDHPTKHW
jgi:hypothetical protein